MTKNHYFVKNGARYFCVLQVVEMIVFHEGRFFTERGHNMHLHGHSFRLLGLGKIAPKLSRDVLVDMDEKGKLRRNFDSPPIMDTVNVPDGGYAVLRFVADNAGKLIGTLLLHVVLHCGLQTTLQAVADREAWGFLLGP